MSKGTTVVSGHWETVCRTIVALATFFFSHRSAVGQIVTIRNDQLVVSVDSQSGELSIGVPNSEKSFLTHGNLGELTQRATKGRVSDKTFGEGQTISLSGWEIPSGSISLFPNLPFALLHLTFKNTISTPQTVNHVPVLSFTVGVDQPASRLKVRGTGGLSDAIKAAGSYEWITVADPRTRAGIVAGWLTHDRATGVLFSKSEANAVNVEARSEYGRLLLAPGQSEQSETLAIGYFPDCRIGLEAWADAIAKVYQIHLPPQPAGYCTWYSNLHGHAGDAKSLAELGDFVRKNFEPYGMNFVQIDDGWQLGEKKNGPKKNFTDFDPVGPYPAGMKPTADALAKQGITPGLWFMPFAGTFDDPWFASRQDLFAKHADGKPYDTKWGGTCLDMTNPKAQEYLRTIAKKITHDWGFGYVKMDGLWTGLAAKIMYVNSEYKDDDFGDAVLFDPTKTNVEAFRTGLKIVREAAGPKVFFLGCNNAQNMRTYGGAFGLVDAMRIGPDNGGTWERWSTRSPTYGARHYFLNGRIWYNDPDPMYVRDSLTTDEARTMASWASLSGQLFTNSDWIPGLSPERIEILKRTILPHGKTARPVDFFDADTPNVWLVSDDKSQVRRDVVGQFNWKDQPAEMEIPIAQIGLPAATAYAAFDFWGNRFLPPVEGESLKAALPPHACQVIAFRPMLDHPFLLSTSCHVVQGMVDVKGELWDADSKTLSGHSNFVAGDPYELRIVAPGSWKATGTQISRADASAGVKAAYKQEGQGVRVIVNSPELRSIDWKIIFSQN